jgi:hypothetical protein
MMGQGGVGPVVTGSGFIGAGELGKTALLRGSIAALAARGLLGKLTKEDVAGMSDAEVEQEAGRRGIPPGGGAGRSPSQDLYAQIKAYQDAASVPSEAEKNRYKLDADRAKGLRDRRLGIEALMPTAKQYGHLQKGVTFDALAGLMSRTGSPDDMPVGQMGERIRAESSRQLGERLGFEDKLAGIDTDIYGVEGGSLDQQAARQRAGDVYDQFTLNAMQNEIMNEAAYKQATDVAGLRLQADRDQELYGLYSMLADEVLPPEERAAILAEIQRRTGSPVSQELIDRMDRMTAG